MKGVGTAPHSHWQLAVAIGAAVALWLALAAWAMASPINSSPDDEYHLGSVYCAAGAECTGEGKREAPCFARNPLAPGSCSTVGSETLPRLDGITATYYPGGYNWVMANFVGETVADTTRNIRLVNVTIATLLVVGSVALSLPNLRAAVTVAWAVTAVPLMIFMVASINPNSWSILGSISLWGPAASVVLQRASPGKTLARSMFAVVAALMALVARNEPPFLIAAISAGLVVLALVQRHVPIWSWAWLRRAALPGTLGALALVFLVFRQTGKIDRLTDAERSEVGPWASFMNYLYELPAALGMPDTPANAMGWSDTLMPAAVPFFGLLAYGGVLAVGLRYWSWRKSLVVGSYFVLMSVPLLYLINATNYVGQIRPRYVLPLFTVLVAFVLLPRLRGGTDSVVSCRFSVAQLVGLALLVSAANSWALATIEIRYLIGLQEWYVWQNPADLLGLVAPQWWWGFLGLSPFALWSVGSLMFAMAVALGLTAFFFNGAVERQSMVPGESA